MLKKSVAKYLHGSKDEILALLSGVKNVQISSSASHINTASLRLLGIPNLPEDYPVLSISETIVENLPRARRDIISLMTLFSPDKKYTRSIVLVSDTAPSGRLYGYLGELPLAESDMLAH